MNPDPSLETSPQLSLVIPIFEKEDDGFYYHELIDWKVTDQKQGEIGIVRGVNMQSPQPLLILDYQNKEVLVPFIDGIIISVNRDQKEIIVALPDGLLEVYLEP